MSNIARNGARGKLAVQLTALVVSRGVLLGATVAVARAAGVSDYGTFALALVIFQAGLLLRDAGLGQALIILGGDSHGLTWRAFIGISCVGALLALAMGIFAGPITNALGLPDSARLLVILALAFGVGSLGVASNASLERQLRFGARAGVDIAAYLALGAVTLVGLTSGQGADSIAWGYVAHGVVVSGAAIVLVPPWRGRHENAVGIRSFVRYGGLLWAGALLAYLSTNLDNALVGKLGGAAAIGVYSLSYTVGNTVTISLAQVLNRVALPYYARAVDHPAALHDTLRSVLHLSVAAAVVPAAVIVAISPEITTTLLGHGESVVPLVALAIYGVVRSLGMSLGTALNGTGSARTAVVGSALNVGVMTVLLVPSYGVGGPAGVALAVLVAMIISTGYLTRAIAARGASFTFTLLPAIALTTLAVVVTILPQPTMLALRLALGGALAVSSAWWAIRLLGGDFELGRAPQGA